MALDPVSSILEIANSAIKRIWPDPEKQAEEQRKLAEIAQKGDLEELQSRVKLITAQLDVNKAEAQHKSIFVAGWRPWIGWVGGVAMAYQFVLYPLLLWVWALWGPVHGDGTPIEPPPVINTDALWTVITGMLGIGAMRSFDKSKGIATDSIKNK